MTTITVVAVCLALVIAAALAAARWGGLELTVPWSAEPGAAPATGNELARRALWWAGLIVLTGVVSGIPVAGAGGRLVMRLLAVTSNDAAQGRITEAEQIVGRVTVDGTIGFILFNGIFSGLATSLAYFATRRWLPRGFGGPLLLGVGLVLVGATRIEPLRADNPDFGIVGPAGVAVATFVSLVVLQALVTHAVAVRLSHALPLLERRPGAIAPYLPLLLTIPAGAIFLSGLVVGLVIAHLSKRAGITTAWHSPAVERAGQVVLAGVAAIATPGAVSSLAGIVG